MLGGERTACQRHIITICSVITIERSLVMFSAEKQIAQQAHREAIVLFSFATLIEAPMVFMGLNYYIAVGTALEPRRSLCAGC